VVPLHAAKKAVLRHAPIKHLRCFMLSPRENGSYAERLDQCPSAGNLFRYRIVVISFAALTGRDNPS
jgi:hypothetical protein